MGPIMKIVGVFSGLALVVGLADPYRRDRILSFLNPGRQLGRAPATRCGSRSSGWDRAPVRPGPRAGREKWGTLPNAHTDFIFSVVGEELGLVGAVAPGPVLRPGLVRAAGGHPGPGPVREPAGGGITTWITSQAVINIGAVIGVLPVTGIPLPFISFGGSSLVITMAAVGILLNIASQERCRRPPPGLRLRPIAGERGRFALVAGGGTAGHLQPALAIAEALVDAGHGRDAIEFVGSAARPGPGRVQRPGFPFTLLPGRGSCAASASGDLEANLGALPVWVAAAVPWFGW
jgi:hypothetical protein